MSFRRLSTGIFNNLSTLFSDNEKVHAILEKLNDVSFPFLPLPVWNGRARMTAQAFDRYLALWLWKLGILESFELNLLASICKPEMIAVDIGANIGYHTLLMAKQIGPQGTVWAFEPEPGNFASLQKNINLNNVLNVHPIQKAVGAKSGKHLLYTSKSHNGDHRIYPSLSNNRVAIPIDIVALDDFFPENQNIDIIKMDIQGAEGLALNGMKRCLTENSNLIMIMEFYPTWLFRSGFKPWKVLTDLRSIGFRLSRIDEERKTLMEINEIGPFLSSISNIDYVNILAIRQESFIKDPDHKDKRLQ